MTLTKGVLRELEDLEKRVAEHEEGPDKTRMESELLSIKVQLRGIYQMEM